MKASFVTYERHKMELFAIFIVWFIAGVILGVKNKKF